MPSAFRSVNLGTGENGNHPDYKTNIGLPANSTVKLTITSNGHSVAVLEDMIACFHDIEFFSRLPNPSEQDANAAQVTGTDSSTGRSVVCVWVYP